MSRFVTTTNLTQAAAATGEITVLAAALDATMSRSEAHRAAYLATWGTEWVPFSVEAARALNSSAPTTSARTVR